MASRERNSFDLRTLAHVMNDGTGRPEVVDVSPVLRIDVLDGLQRYLAKRHEAQAILEASGYFGVIDEATAILNDNPDVSMFLASIKDDLLATAYTTITDIGAKVAG